MSMKNNNIIELTVQNHPGVMSHVTGLFSRRGYNMEGILCSQIGDGTLSRMYLLVEEKEQLEQIMQQLRKLNDVLDVNLRTDYDHTVFSRLHEFVKT